MISKTSYLLRAFYDWIVDNNLTPYLVLDTTDPKTNVPEEFIRHGQITLNISPNAIRDLSITKKNITFRSSFSGEVKEIYAPMRAAISIYAKENGEGIDFDLEDIDFDEDDDKNSETNTSGFEVIK